MPLSSIQPPRPTSPPPLHTAANLTAAAAALGRLGGVPQGLLVNVDWQPEGPHPHAVLLLLAFAVPRLLEVSKEDRAATVLQRAWRKRHAALARTGVEYPSYIPPSIYISIYLYFYYPNII